MLDAKYSGKHHAVRLLCDWRGRSGGNPNRSRVMVFDGGVGEKSARRDVSLTAGLGKARRPGRLLPKLAPTGSCYREPARITEARPFMVPPRALCMFPLRIIDRFKLYSQ